MILTGENRSRWRKHLWQGHFVYHRYHIEMTGFQPGSSSWQAGE